MRNRITRIMAAGVVMVSVCAAQETSKPAQGETAAPATPAVENPNLRPAQPYGALYQPADKGAEPEAQSVPDTRPLAGILGLTLGWARANENKLTAGFNFAQLFDSNPGIAGRSGDYTGVSSIGGSLDLHRSGKQQALDIAYNGGVNIYNDTGDYLSYHGLNLAQSFSMRRWTFTLTDGLNYSPQGALGSGLGSSNYGAGFLGLGGINSQLTPNQSVYTSLARQLSNTAGAGVEYGLSPRSSWSAGMTYGNVIFPDGQLGNTHQINARTGYNRNWTAKDTVSILYSYGAYRGNSGFGAGLDTHSVQLAYARRLTGRLSFSVSAGPEMRQDDLTDEREVSWTAATSMQYQRANTGVTMSYNHGVSGIAAVGGATTDSLQLGVTRVLARYWNVGLTGSLNRNAQLVGTAEFRSGFAGVQVRRNLGAHASVYANYGYQRQISEGNCTVALLCTSLNRQVFGFGFSWNPQSWILR